MKFNHSSPRAQYLGANILSNLYPQNHLELEEAVWKWNSLDSSNVSALYASVLSFRCNHLFLFQNPFADRAVQSKLKLDHTIRLLDLVSNFIEVMPNISPIYMDVDSMAAIPKEFFAFPFFNIKLPECRDDSVDAPKIASLVLSWMAWRTLANLLGPYLKYKNQC